MHPRLSPQLHYQSFLKAVTPLTQRMRTQAWSFLHMPRLKRSLPLPTGFWHQRLQPLQPPCQQSRHIMMLLHQLLEQLRNLSGAHSATVTHQTGSQQPICELRKAAPLFRDQLPTPHSPSHHKPSYLHSHQSCRTLALTQSLTARR